VDIAIAASEKLIAEKTTAAAKAKLFTATIGEVKSKLN
jgi:F-type H+-transporting ATPase subunit b